MESDSLLPILGAAPFINLLYWAGIGIVAGALARAILPGEQKMNLVLTALLGVGGALLGGFITPVLNKDEPMWLQCVAATAGAFILLVVVQSLGFFKKKG